MSLKKIKDPEIYPKPCSSPYHDPPEHMVYEDGEYEWTCSACGFVTRFSVRRPMHGTESSASRLWYYSGA